MQKGKGLLAQAWNERYIICLFYQIVKVTEDCCFLQIYLLSVSFFAMVFIVFCNTVSCLRSYDEGQDTNVNKNKWKPQVSLQIRPVVLEEESGSYPPCPIHFPSKDILKCYFFQKFSLISQYLMRYLHWEISVRKGLKFLSPITTALIWIEVPDTCCLQNTEESRRSSHILHISHLFSMSCLIWPWNMLSLAHTKWVSRSHSYTHVWIILHGWRISEMRVAIILSYDSGMEMLCQ